MTFIKQIWNAPLEKFDIYLAIGYSTFIATITSDTPIGALEILIGALTCIKIGRALIDRHFAKTARQ